MIDTVAYLGLIVLPSCVSDGRRKENTHRLREREFQRASSTSDNYIYFIRRYLLLMCWIHTCECAAYAGLAFQQLFLYFYSISYLWPTLHSTWSNRISNRGTVKIQTKYYFVCFHRCREMANFIGSLQLKVLLNTRTILLSEDSRQFNQRFANLYIE